MFFFIINHQRPSPDVKAALFALLHSILQNNWRYFFKSNILSGLLPVERTLASSESDMDHQEQFVAIMEAFGQSFLQPDISIFKQNIEYLEKLNTKWKLYHKVIMIQSLMASNNFVSNAENMFFYERL